MDIIHVEDGAHLSLAGQDSETHAYFWVCPRCQRKLITGEYIEESKTHSDETSTDEKGTDEKGTDEVSKGEETSQEVENKQVERKRHRRS